MGLPCREPWCGLTFCPAVLYNSHAMLSTFVSPFACPVLFSGAGLCLAGARAGRQAQLAADQGNGEKRRCSKRVDTAIPEMQADDPDDT